MNARELLEQAIALARPSCLECGCDLVVVVYRPGLGWIPLSYHRANSGPGDSCPVLAGGLPAHLAHEDLWAALEPYLLVAHYGEVALAGRCEAVP